MNALTGVSIGAAPGQWDADFQLLGGPSFNNSVAANPYGQFDLGAALGGNWEGGGAPQGGIGVGASQTFVFNLTGANMASLTSGSFLTALSSGASPGQGAQFFVARFRGLTDGGSDKVPAVPEPETYAIMLAGLGVLAFMARRRLK
jgi:hypothetical protein